jgi:glycosyltransferase involved in cell wall biosynthesis
MGVSIIIPTFNNVNYIDECIISVINSSIDFDFEILIGIDSCLPTLSHVNSKNYSDNVNFYFFEKNVGPYVVRNTLSLEARFNNIIFFDSDDIMSKEFVSTVLGYLERYDCVKPKLINFTYEFGRKKLEPKRRLWGEGVFGIKKSLFLSMNGFEPWMCAADSDFIGRLYKNNKKVLNTNEILMERRIHNQGLTSRRDTGFLSGLRKHYSKLSKSKKYFGPLEKMVTENFKKLNGYEIPDNFKILPFIPNFGLSNEGSEKNIINKILNTERKTILDKVLNSAPRKVVNQPIKKKDPVINDRTDLLYTNPKPLVRTIKPNKPDNRQELINLKNNTNKSVNKQLFSTKPERRTGINPITIGGKSKL